MSRGTWRAIGGAGAAGAAALRARRRGDRRSATSSCIPFTVPHDAAEPLQLRCSDGARASACSPTWARSPPHVLDHLAGCDALLLECNHDAAMLAARAIRASLKARVGGRFGHLCNATAARDPRALRAAHGLRHVVAAHLSERTTGPTLARAALAALLGQRPRRHRRRRSAAGFDWLQID